MILNLLDGVREVVRVTQPYKLASRAFRPAGTIVELPRGVRIGGAEVVVAAGPCSVESAEQMDLIAGSVAKLGAKILRGGAFKPRSSPYSFQGLGEKGLRIMRDAADKHGLLVVSEVMDASQIQMMLPYVDILQVGARNMQNYFSASRIRRGRESRAAQAGTFRDVRGVAAKRRIHHGWRELQRDPVRARYSHVRDVHAKHFRRRSAIPVIKKLSHLPILVDPSHGTGRRDKSSPHGSSAAITAGADGLLLEVHNDPEHALSDGAQSLFFEQFEKLMAEMRLIAPIVGRTASHRPWLPPFAASQFWALD